MCKHSEGGYLFFRNQCNHFLLNKILAARYHTRKNIFFTKAIIWFELLLVKTRIIYKGQQVKDV